MEGIRAEGQKEITESNDDNKDNKKARLLKKFLKPGIGKIILFLILAFFVTILPIYPTHVDKYNGFESYTMDQFESTYTDYQSFGTVLYNDFNWTEIEFTPYSPFIPNDELLRHYSRSYLDADPAFIYIYIPIFIAVYFVSCYYVELQRHDRVIK